MKQVFNPFLPSHVCIADGEPHVFDDRVYLFGPHDQEGGDSFCMLSYEFWSAPVDDLTAWSCPGTSYRAEQDPLYSRELCYMYAPDVVRGNDGRFYLYYCLSGWKGTGGYSGPISVAVCDTPDGKYEYLGRVQNPDGTPYLDFICFDPAVINDDGVIRLYFGTGPFRGMETTWWNRRILRKIYSKIYGRSAEAFLKSPHPLGANAAVLMDDMLTLSKTPKRILPERPRKSDFRGHSFFEASSVRKIGTTYYFIYSSEKNHELCYATSPYPDRDFQFGGTIISNGDVDYDGRKEKDRANTTGTNHGSIECINGQWYVFYHRESHGTDYSRQSCAEKITILPDGSIRQVQMTSCGLNNGDLSGVGKYPATICCNLTNGKMPHTANRIRKSIPMVTHEAEERFVANAFRGTKIVYRYFDLNRTNAIVITARGNADIQVYFADSKAGTVHVNSQNWKEYELLTSPGSSHAELRFIVTKGSADIVFFELIFGAPITGKITDKVSLKTGQR